MNGTSTPYDLVRAVPECQISVLSPRNTSALRASRPETRFRARATGPTGHMRLSGLASMMTAPSTPRYDGAVHSSLRFHSSAASSGVATRLGARSAHLS